MPGRSEDNEYTVKGEEEKMSHFNHENVSGFTDEEIAEMKRLFDQKIRLLSEEDRQNESYLDCITEQILLEMALIL